MNFKQLNVLVGTMAFLAVAPSLAIDLNDFGDFSSRSVIMNNIAGKERLTQEQKDILKERKLAPSTQCLVEQIKKGNIQNVEILLESKVDPNKTYYSDPPIYIASKRNKADIVELLIHYGAKLDRGFYSELYEATRNKNTPLAQFLLDNGARVNYTDSITNNTILSMALKNNMVDIASQLIKKGARADVKSIKLIKKKKLAHLIEKD